MAKVPIYVLNAEAFKKEFDNLLSEYPIRVEDEILSDIKKEIWINKGRIHVDISEDDCIVTGDDQFLEVDALNLTYLLRITE